VAASHTEPELGRFGHPDDVILAPGFGAAVGRNADIKNFSIGRSLGRDEGYGIALDKQRQSLVITARGTVGPVVINLTQRIGPDELKYWEYHLAVGEEMKRYEVPLRKFIPRGGASKPLTSIHSITLRVLNPVKKGDQVVVDFFGLAKEGVALTSIDLDSPTQATARLIGAKDQPCALYYKDASGHKAKLYVDDNRFLLPREARTVWVCFEKSRASAPGEEILRADERITVCDPPDAPLTTYQVPPNGDDPLVVDRFDTKTGVNAFRIPFVVFGSSQSVEEQTTVERLHGSLRLTFYPEEITDYAGYLSYLPESAPETYKTLAITVRGSIPPNNLLAGIKDASGREARIPFISYWLGDETAANPLYDIEGMNPKSEADEEGFRTVLFPIDAFRTVFYNVFKGHAELRDIRGVSVTMSNGGEEVFHDVEIRRVELIDKVVPITVTAFDGDMYGINALGGVNFSESQKGGDIDVRLNSDGYYGAGLRVKVTLPRNDSYALVAMGFGRLDVTDYKYLTFYVRGKFGDEEANIYLNDGETRAAVKLESYKGISKMWRKVKIPLSDFLLKGVNLTRVSQLILAWEDKITSEQEIYFDNFMFE
jgi:hypothetical protein